MDTANKIALLAREKGLDLIVTGCPKTIDNDIGDDDFKIIDHTPGYGSVARYWALNIQNANEENMGSSTSDPVLVIQTMGREIGFVPAAARLADPYREFPLQIYLPESNISLPEMADLVNDSLKENGRCIIVINDCFNIGKADAIKDNFGHIAYSSNKITAEQVVVNYLNENGLCTRGFARGNVSGTDQRHNIIYASTIDLDEAYKLGQKAVLIALQEGSGYMSTILRQSGEIYNVYYDKVPLVNVANSERRFPLKWISSNRIDVTDEFLCYSRPLIGDQGPNVPLINGLQRFSRLDSVIASKELPEYSPQAYRSQKK